ncbi:hypothetical protein [Zavarzinella formosa]|uniref:hypothetical protein n=1 Tax=Zavarzinella formosa TaxID=360055 RepID=UPI0002FEF24A|nr:hypothetical protein [Zavarzinella formosa]
MTQPTFSVAHGGNAGDLIWSLPSIVSLLELRDLKTCTLLLKADQPARYHPGMNHPCGQYKMSRAFCESLIPLLRLQAVFEDVKIWDGESIDLDLDLFRSSGFSHDRGDIGQYYSHVWPCLPKLWEKWLDVEPDPKAEGMILLNRTERYLNPKIEFKWLERLKNLAFVGLDAEFAAFRKKHRLNIPHIKTRTFLDFARKIAGCRMFIGNQSSGFAIAEGLKVPRILEVFPSAPNVQPHGPGGWQFFNQEVFEALVHRLAA